MKKMILITLAALAASAIASAQDVNYNYDNTQNFASFHTYKWVTIEGSAQLDQITMNQLTAAVEAGLAQKGLTKVDSDSADLVIGMQVSTSASKQLNMWGGGMGRFGGGMATANVSTIVNGSFDLDMYIPATHTLVWRGVATKTIDTGANPEKRQKNITSGVTKLLKNYPPPVKK